jgi:NADH dehydrogenase FAD-containing subunit
MSIYHNRKEVRRIKASSITGIDKNELKITGKDVTSKVPITKVPFGVCIWATGNAPHPLITKLCAKIPGTFASNIKFIQSPQNKSTHRDTDTKTKKFHPFFCCFHFILK